MNLHCYLPKYTGPRLQIGIVVLSLFACLIPLPLPAATKAKPNILFIITDQQHSGMMSCAGNTYLKTPVMDSLARNGVRFERAYSANPVCVPARVAMFTGQYPSRFGMQSNKELQSTIIPPAAQQETMGQVLQQAGYETAYGGKTHLPGNLAKYGFDYLTNDQRDSLATTCSDFLKKKHDKPFLLVASFINPHDICYMAINAFEQSQTKKNSAKAKKGASGPHQECLEAALKKPAGMTDTEFYSQACPPLPANFEPQIGGPEAIAAASYQGFRGFAFTNWTEKEWRWHRWAYARLTERVDAEIGVVMQALRESGQEENTVVIFTSDHGDHDSAHRLEHKSTFYEEAVHVPFIISQKGMGQAGKVEREHLVSAHLDLIPTLCDYAGVAAPASMKGRSLRALAEGRTVNNWRPYVVSETHFGRMVCSGRYKYCAYEKGDHREQFVDLEKDPGEMHNLIADKNLAPLIEQHRSYLQEWISSYGDQFAQSYAVKPAK